MRVRAYESKYCRQNENFAYDIKPNCMSRWSLFMRVSCQINTHGVAEIFD